MKKTSLSIFVSILFLTVILAACTGIATSPTLTAQPAAESASGVVTAEGKLLPAPATELGFAQGGVVAEVLVKAGDKVTAGEVLARLVGIKIAQADLATAQTQYDQTYSSAITQNGSRRFQDWYETQSSIFTLPVWYYDQQEQISAARSAIDKAQEALAKSQEKLATVMQTTGGEFIKAEIDLSSAQADYNVANNLNNHIKNGKNIDELSQRQLSLLQRDAYLKSKAVSPKWVTINTIDKDLRAEAQRIFDDAVSALKDAQDSYDDAVSTDGAKDILKTRAQVSIAQERLFTAQDNVRALQTGASSQAVNMAISAIEKAKAVLELYELRAPISGTVLALDLKMGQTASPGVPVVFLADTTSWTVETKDLAEPDIVRVMPDQIVTVRLDALPGEEFPGKVTKIDPVGKEYLSDMTYKVTIKLNQADPRFLWNMTANVDIDAK
jgi:HlyD family secretion protein